MNNRGIAIGEIVMWGAGVLATSAIAFSGFVSNKVSQLEDKNTQIVQRVSVVETESSQYKDDIKDIKDEIKEINKILIEINKKIR
jgi:septal ring factor EnvC (AmiA/AmiB activator)